MTQKPTITKQIMGALGGAAIALVAYSGYEIVAPRLAAYTSVPQSRTIPSNGMYFRSSADELDTDYYNRVAQRTRQIVQQFGQDNTVDISEGFVDDPNKSRTEQYMEAVTTQPTAPVVQEPVVQEPVAEPVQEVVQEPVAEPAAVLEADDMRAQVVAKEVTHMPAEGLPSSGIGAWLFAILACAIAGVRHVRKGMNA